MKLGSRLCRVFGDMARLAGLAVLAGLLAGGASLRAEENTLAVSMSGRTVPIQRAEAVQRPILEGDQFQLSLRLDPMQQNNYDGFSRQQMVGNNFAVAYQMKLTSTLDATYEIVAGALKGDVWLLSTGTDSSYDTFGVSHKAGVAWQASKVFVLHFSAMGSTTMHADTGGQDTTQQLAGDVLYTVWKDGSLGVQGSIGDTTPFKKSILAQERLGTSFTQKLPWSPLTLQTGSALAKQDAPTPSADDSVSLKNTLAVQWAVQPNLLTWAVGVEDTQGQYRLDDVNESLRSYYTQTSLTPDSIWNFTLRTSYDTHGKGPDSAYLYDKSVNLTLGVNMKVNDRFGAGVVLRYRVPASAQPASTPGGVGDTMLSISATSLF